MREAVIVASARTPLGKSFRGSLNATRPDDMAATAIKGALARVPQLSVTEIEDVICGCGLPEGPSGMNVARVATLAAGLPETIAATTVNRFCSSGLQAIGMAAHQIINEGANAAIGAGTESISMVQGQQNMNNLVNSSVQELWPGLYMDMGQTAEIVAERYKNPARGPGQVLAPQPAAYRRGAARGQVHRDHSDEGEEGREGRVRQPQVRGRRGHRVRTSATAPTRRSKACSVSRPRSAVPSRRATPRSSPTARR